MTKLYFNIKLIIGTRVGYDMVTGQFRHGETSAYYCLRSRPIYLNVVCLSAKQTYIS